MIQGSPGAGTGDSLGRTLSLPRPLSLLPRGMAVLDREPAGAEREGEKWGLGAQGCAGTVVAGPQKEAPPPHRLVRDREHGLGSDHPAG